MKKIFKAIVIILVIILLYVYLETGFYPFQKQVVLHKAQKYMSEAYPEFEIQEVEISFDWITGYKVYLISTTGGGGWLYYPIFPFWKAGKLLDLDKPDPINTYASECSRPIFDKAQELITDDLRGFSLAFIIDLTREELAFMYENQIEVKDSDIVLRIFYESPKDEFLTINQFADKAWPLINTIMQNGLKFKEIEMNYMTKNFNTGYTTNNVYKFNWYNTMGELTKDAILPLIQVINQ